MMNDLRDTVKCSPNNKTVTCYRSSHEVLDFKLLIITKYIFCKNISIIYHIKIYYLMSTAVWLN